ncbi:MAG TPA: hypothetical protein VIQ55_06380 [Burkholderiales bacterium]|jgi:type II secretory pathway pseudopilin PulG
MKTFVGRKKAQQGAALMLLLAILVLGTASYLLVALGKAAPTIAEREERTAAALQAAKEALLAYVALKAADPGEDNPGRLPCPEHPGQPGTAQEGIAAPFPGFPNCTQVGRLPWKTLGIDQLRDAEGEPLWYAVATGTWALLTTTTPALSINPGLANQLAYDVAPLPTPNVVAVIIAPGRSLNTLSAGTPPSGCATVNQQANRYAIPYAAAKFLECGNEASNYRKAGPAGWSNDRTIAITAAEVMDAIMGPVAERVQRQVAPAMNDWYNFQSLFSWGESFLPHASPFDSLANNPTVNNLCGGHNVREGMPPTATVASGTCNTNWSSGNATALMGLSFGGCAPGASEMRCTFISILGGLASPRISATAPGIANSFRSFDPGDIRIEINGGAPQPVSIQSYSASVSSSNSSASIDVRIGLPLLSILANVVVRIPNPVDAALIDDRTRWFVSNGWDRFTYYAVPRAVTVNPGPDDCRSSKTSECITVSGMPDPTDRKRFILALMGQRALPGLTWPGASVTAYLEAENATTGDREFDANRLSANFNDRLAACPHTLVTATGSRVICAW